eukprot:gene14934-biopygen4102
MVRQLQVVRTRGDELGQSVMLVDGVSCGNPLCFMVGGIDPEVGPKFQENIHVKSKNGPQIGQDNSDAHTQGDQPHQEGDHIVSEQVRVVVEGRNPSKVWAERKLRQARQSQTLTYVFASPRTLSGTRLGSAVDAQSGAE